MNKYKEYFNKFKYYIKIISPFRNKFSTKEQAIFIKKLSFLIRSGSSIVESIILIKKQTKSKTGIKNFDQIIVSLKNGRSLASSFENCQKSFNNFTINIIRAGEQTGNLIENLDYLAEELKKKELLRHKIMGALFYPVIIMSATLGITGFLILYIFPKILPIFQGLGAKLPLSTRIIISISGLIRNYGFQIFLSLIITTFIILILIKNNSKARMTFDNFILHLPILGKIFKNYNITNFCRTLGLLLKSNTPITKALMITSNTMDNLQYKKYIQDIHSEIIKGKNLSDLMSRSPFLFPGILCQMISIGEKSGNLPDAFIYLSEFYESEFDDLTKNLSNSIEPFLMIIMGIAVGFVAISFITPIYEITNNLKR